MATGTAFGGSCYASQAEAAQMFCSATSGVSAAGVVQCVAHDVTAGEGGAVAFNWTRRLVDGAGVTADAVVGGSLGACETYGVDYWQPYVGAFTLALVAITAAKLVYMRIFKRETL